MRALLHAPTTTTNQPTGRSVAAARASAAPAGSPARALRVCGPPPAAPACRASPLTRPAASTVRSDSPPAVGTIGPDVSGHARGHTHRRPPHAHAPALHSLSRMRFPLSPPPFSFSFPKGIIDVVVVGGGISGLVTAQALLTDHADTVGR